MIRIDKKYAIIYIDENFDTKDCQSFTTADMISNYYNNPGPLQWNYYLFIPEDKLGDVDKKIIENNEEYTRKYVLKDLDFIYRTIEIDFPDLDENIIQKCEFTLITGDTWIKVLDKVDSENINSDVVNVYSRSNERNVKIIKNNKTKIFNSYLRDYNTILTLGFIDEIRAYYVLGGIENIYYLTHIEDEMFLVKQKFKFLGENFKII